MAEKDVKDASVGVLRDLKRFQAEKENDLRRYMVCSIFPCPNLLFSDPPNTYQISFAKCHIEWAKRNQQSWEEAKQEIQHIEAAATE